VSESLISSPCSGSYPSFPRGYEAAKRRTDPYEPVEHLENAFARDIKDPRFVPYIQLHEFEALIFSSPERLGDIFIDREAAIERLIAVRTRFNSPELIDDGPTTAPSKRTIQEIPEYEGQKASAGPLITQAIGLQVMLKECKHFREWLECLCKLVQVKNEP
jgi:hypothetical protein